MVCTIGKSAAKRLDFQKPVFYLVLIQISIINYGARKSHVITLSEANFIMLISAYRPSESLVSGDVCQTCLFQLPFYLGVFGLFQHVLQILIVSLIGTIVNKWTF